MRSTLNKDRLIHDFEYFFTYSHRRNYLINDARNTGESHSQSDSIQHVTS